MASMLPRMGVPLAGALMLQMSPGPLAEAGVMYYLLVFYPITLAIETLLSLPPSKAPSKSPRDVV